MSKISVTKEVLDNKTLINKFKSKNKYFFENKFSNAKLKSIDINENYRLDCGEFDDNIEKSIKKLSKFFITVESDVKNFDQINGVDYYNGKIENDKKNKIKEFLDKLNDEKNEISHKISVNDKEFELAFKEKNDAIFQKEKESKVKLTEINKKLNVDLAKEEYRSLKKCDAIEKNLLATNNRDEIKKLLEEQKQIRLESLKNIFEIKSKYYLEQKDLKIFQANQRIEEIIKVNEFKTNALKLRNQDRKDIEEIIEKIKAREDYYLYYTSKDGVIYFKNLIKEFESKKTKANEDGYLIEKEILSLRLKQIKFIEKEFSIVYKNLSNLFIELLDEYFDNMKVLLDIYRKYYNYFDPKFKKNPDDPKNKKEIINLIRNINSLIVTHNQIFIEKANDIFEDEIKYIKYHTLGLKEKLVAVVQEHNKKTTDINLFIQNSKSSDNFDEIYRDKLKELYNVSILFSKEIKSVLKDYGNEAKEFVSEYCKKKSLNLNNDTVEIDKKFTSCRIIDNSYFDTIITNYQNYINNLNKIIASQEMILSKLGVIPTKNLNEKFNKLDSDYQELVNVNKKSLSETLKTIEREYKNSMIKCEQNRKELISRL